MAGEWGYTFPFAKYSWRVVQKKSFSKKKISVVVALFYFELKLPMHFQGHWGRLGWWREGSCLFELFCPKCLKFFPKSILVPQISWYRYKSLKDCDIFRIWALKNITNIPNLWWTMQPSEKELQEWRYCWKTFCGEPLLPGSVGLVWSVDWCLKS